MFTDRLFLFVLFFLVNKTAAVEEGEDEEEEEEPQGALQDTEVAVDVI